MEKLYYEDQYTKNFTAEIIDIIEISNEFHIILDKTYFYPGCEDYPCDTGFIESNTIKQVYEKNGVIYHVSDTKPLKIHKVKCSINWEQRFDNMQQHLGQHILSAVFLKLFNGNTIKHKFEKDYCSIDIDKILTNDQIENAIEVSNKIIFDNIDVEFLYPTKAELKKLSIKKPLLKSGEQIRIVKIEDTDISQCYGLHPISTIEVQLIKILSYEHFKNSTKIKFLCGKRAVENSILKDKFTFKICNYLNCDEDIAINKIEEIKENIKILNNENNLLKSKVADLEVKEIIDNGIKIKNITIIKSIYENTDIKYIKLLASKLTTFENIIVLFAIKHKDSCNLLFMCSKNFKNINMNSLLKDAISLIDGNGGGNNFSAQGGGKNINNLNSSLDYAFIKVENLLDCK